MPAARHTLARKSSHMCDHTLLRAHVSVDRGKKNRITASLSIRCRQCGFPFEFPTPGGPATKVLTVQGRPVLTGVKDGPLSVMTETRLDPHAEERVPDPELQPRRIHIDQAHRGPPQPLVTPGADPDPFEVQGGEPNLDREPPASDVELESRGWVVGPDGRMQPPPPPGRLGGRKRPNYDGDDL